MEFNADLIASKTLDKLEADTLKVKIAYRPRAKNRAQNNHESNCRDRGRNQEPSRLGHEADNEQQCRDKQRGRK